MKKNTILVAMVLIGSIAKASEKIIILDDRNKTENRFNANEPIQFNERGIEFFVFANGEFDFNTHPDDSQGGYYYKTAGRKDIEMNRMPQDFGILIEHDNFGRVRRIGNTFINYDFNNRVTRIGTVFMKYNRFSLIQIGGLQIVYNRFGEIIDMFGSVKSRQSYGFTYNNNQSYSNNHDNNFNNYNNNNSSYYYKKDNENKDKSPAEGRR